MDEITYQKIINEMRHNKDTLTLIETVIFDAERANGFLGKEIRHIIEAAYERGLRDGRASKDHRS